jgi:hypothetical protein
VVLLLIGRVDAIASRMSQGRRDRSGAIALSSLDSTPRTGFILAA